MESFQKRERDRRKRQKRQAKADRRKGRADSKKQRADDARLVSPPIALPSDEARSPGLAAEKASP